MLSKTFLAAAVAASLGLTAVAVAPAEAASRTMHRHHAVHWWQKKPPYVHRYHPRPLPHRHGMISVAGLPGHHPAYHRRHVVHHKPMHHKASDKK